MQHLLLEILKEEHPGFDFSGASFSGQAPSVVALEGYDTNMVESYLVTFVGQISEKTSHAVLMCDSAFKPSIVIDIDPYGLEQMALLRLLLPCCLFFASATGVSSDAKIVLLGWTGETPWSSTKDQSIWVSFLVAETFFFQLQVHSWFIGGLGEMDSVFIVTEDGSICRKAKQSNSEESETSEVHIGHHMVDTPGFGDNRGMQDLHWTAPR